MRLRENDLVWQEVRGEIIVLDSKSSRYLQLSGSGALLWNKLEEGATHDDLVATLIDAYEVDRDRAVADVEAFTSELRQRKLLADDD